jgi:hypothetical protein
VIHALTAFTSVTYPLHHEVPFGFVGMMLGLIALLGLYPQLVTKSPKVAQGGAILALLGIVGWVVIGVRALLEDIGVTPPALVDAFAPLVIVGVILGYLAYGLAGVRANIVSPRTGFAVMTPALVMIFNITIAITLSDLSVGPVIVASGFALSHLFIGLTLRSEEFVNGRTETASRMAT